MQLFSPEQDSDPILQRHLRTLLADLSPVARAVLLLRFQGGSGSDGYRSGFGYAAQHGQRVRLKRSLEAMRAKIAGMPSVRCGDSST